MRMTEAMAALAGKNATIVDTKTILRSPADAGGGGRTSAQEYTERAVSLG